MKKRLNSYTGCSNHTADGAKIPKVVGKGQGWSDWCYDNELEHMRVTDWGQGCLSSQHLWFLTKGESHDISPCYVLIAEQGFPSMRVTCVVVTPSSRGPPFKRQGLLYIALMLHSGRKHLNFYGFPAITNFSSNCQDLLHAE